jgi:hypothetical protein
MDKSVKEANKRRSHTNWRSKEGSIRTKKESEREGGIHILESAGVGIIQDIERKREMGDTHGLQWTTPRDSQDTE